MFPRRTNREFKEEFGERIVSDGGKTGPRSVREIDVVDSAAGIKRFVS